MATDRLPDATNGFAVHVIYAHPPGSPNRFAEWAPRIAGDVAAIDAWWRTQDAARTPRFDLFAFPCATVFGALDISRLQLPTPLASPIESAFGGLRAMVANGYPASEKVYLVYYDGPTAQSGSSRICGMGAAPRRSAPGLAVILLDSCGSDTSDTLRPVVAVHEIAHVLGAVGSGAPHLCRGGHVCDVPNDLLAATLSGTPLEGLVLDGGRDDYYGHAGPWLDMQDSLFLERLDSPDRAAPTTPARLSARAPAAGATGVFSWAAVSDDVGPVAYRISHDGRFVETVRGTTAPFPNVVGRVTRLSVRAVDAVGHLSPPAEILFKGGVGIVDAGGRLVLDTVAPPAIPTVKTIRLPRVVFVSWHGVRDAGGLRGYRVKIGTRTVAVTRATAARLDRTSLRAPVTVAAVDRAGNVGPARTIPLSRLR